MIRAGAAFGSFPTLELENERVRIVVCPALGARVLSLVDLPSGREWLVQGEPPAGDGVVAPTWLPDDAVFGGDVAYGWDECLPTVGPCADPSDPAGPPLRDHGEQWGRPTSVEADGDALVAAWAGDRHPYRFTRRIRLDRGRIVAEYAVTNDGPVDLPVLWSMHPLLALEPDARISVEGLSSVRVTQAVGVGIAPVPGRVDWPEALGIDGRPITLDIVRGVSAGTALKLYGGWEMYGAFDATAGEGLPGVASVRQPDGSRLGIAWYAPIARSLGLWLSDGGWPSATQVPRVQHALAPTTSPDDDLASAVRGDRALVVAPAERVAWEASFTVQAPGERR